MWGGLGLRLFVLPLNELMLFAWPFCGWLLGFLRTEKCGDWGGVCFRDRTFL